MQFNNDNETENKIPELSEQSVNSDSLVPDEHTKRLRSDTYQDYQNQSPKVQYSKIGVLRLRKLNKSVKRLRVLYLIFNPLKALYINTRSKVMKNVFRKWN